MYYFLSGGSGALQQKEEYECYLHIQSQLNQSWIIKHEFINQLSTIHALISNHESAEDIKRMVHRCDDCLKMQHSESGNTDD